MSVYLFSKRKEVIISEEKNLCNKTTTIYFSHNIITYLTNISNKKNRHSHRVSLIQREYTLSVKIVPLFMQEHPA